MKTIIAVIVLTTLLGACGKKEVPAPKADTANSPLVDSKAVAEGMAAQMAASEKTSAAERAVNEKNQAIDSLYEVARRWDGAVESASKMNRVKLGDALKSMQSIKAEAETLAVNDCTGKARGLLVASMAASLEAFNRFKSETGDASEATRQKNKEAANLLAESSAELATCKAP